MNHSHYTENYVCECGVYCFDLDGELFELDPLEKSIFKHKCEVE